MKSRLARLRRLERLRTIARDTAAGEAAQAEGTLAQLRSVAARAGQLASDYAARPEAQTGAELIALGQFADGLRTVHAGTLRDAGAARAAADLLLAALAEAERRRTVVRDRAEMQARLDAAPEAHLPVSARRSGTGLE